MSKETEETTTEALSSITTHHYVIPATQRGWDIIEPDAYTCEYPAEARLPVIAWAVTLATDDTTGEVISTTAKPVVADRTIGKQDCGSLSRPDGLFVNIGGTAHQEER